MAGGVLPHLASISRSFLQLSSSRLASFGLPGPDFTILDSSLKISAHPLAFPGQRRFPADVLVGEYFAKNG